MTSQLDNSCTLVTPIESLNLEDGAAEVGEAPIYGFRDAHQIFQELIKDEVIIVSMDVEKTCSYTPLTRPQQLCEVGIATLDTRDINGTIPGDRGSNFFPYIKARHARIREYVHAPSWKKHHTKRCKPVADKFLYGLTEWVRIADLPEWIRRLFDTLSFDGADQQRRKLAVVTFCRDTEEEISRTHNLRIFDSDAPWDIQGYFDIQKDAAFGRKLGSAIGRANQVGLDDVVKALGLTTSYLHNGGNDAVAELHCMIAEAYLDLHQLEMLSYGVEPPLPQTWPEPAPFNPEFPPDSRKRPEGSKKSWNHTQDDQGQAGHSAVHYDTAWPAIVPPTPRPVMQPGRGRGRGATFAQAISRGGGLGRGRGQGYLPTSTQGTGGASARGRGLGCGM